MPSKKKKQQQPKQQGGSAREEICATPHRPPVAPTRNALRILNVSRALLSQTALSDALARANFYLLNVPKIWRGDQSANASSQTSNTSELSSRASLLAHFEGKPRKRPQWWIWSSSTLESLDPTTPESEMGDPREVVFEPRFSRVVHLFDSLMAVILPKRRQEEGVEENTTRSGLDTSDASAVGEERSGMVSFPEIFDDAARRIAQRESSRQALAEIVSRFPRGGLPRHETELDRAEELLRRHDRLARGLPADPLPRPPRYVPERPADCPCARLCVCYRTGLYPDRPPTDRPRLFTQLRLPLRFALGNIANTLPTVTQGLNTLAPPQDHSHTIPNRFPFQLAPITEQQQQEADATLANSQAGLQDLLSFAYRHVESEEGSDVETDEEDWLQMMRGDNPRMRHRNV